MFQCTFILSIGSYHIMLLVPRCPYERMQLSSIGCEKAIPIMHSYGICERFTNFERISLEDSSEDWRDSSEPQFSRSEPYPISTTNFYSILRHCCNAPDSLCNIISVSVWHFLFSLYLTSFTSHPSFVISFLCFLP